MAGLASEGLALISGSAGEGSSAVVGSTPTDPVEFRKCARDLKTLSAARKYTNEERGTSRDAGEGRAQVAVSCQHARRSLLPPAFLGLVKGMELTMTAHYFNTKNTITVSSFDKIVDFLRFISKNSLAMHQHQNASDVGTEKVTRLIRKQRVSSLHRQNYSMPGHLSQVVAVFLQIFHSITRRHGIATRCFISPHTRLFSDETRRVFVSQLSCTDSGWRAVGGFKVSALFAPPPCVFRLTKCISRSTALVHAQHEPFVLCTAPQ